MDLLSCFVLYGEWTPSNGVVYAVFLACVLCHGVLASTLSKIMGKLQTVFVAMNLILIAATIIALPVGKRLSSERNDAQYIFTKTENLTTWPTGWAFMLSLLCLIAPAAASALFSLAVAGNNVAWLTPILCRVVWGQKKFVPGPFYTGDRFSVPLAWFAVVFLVFGIFLAMFPVGGPNPTAESMNYTVVINMFVWGGALAYYFIDARKWFTGPKITVEDVPAGMLADGSIEGVETGHGDKVLVDEKGKESV
ncbi:putative GABA-specific permease [Glarea lozoyensis 74030]|uniref:Putative GABA-specific permease n=1 Tax=Glarea lozoyensis (strain ATCC 74030 / MF5533) TaxID=1104152 RepID=H0ELS7_GLAL7|nr:putative GABA-specific permease [Glarea lozoyensis 74030]